MFLPPAKKSYTGPRLLTVDINNTEADSSSTSDILGNLTNGPLISESMNEPSSISDHIVDLKNNQSNKKLNYSRAVQCLSLPDECKNCKDLEITSILSTQDDSHILLTVCSKSSLKSFLLLYALDFTNKMVKVNEESVMVRELFLFEKPLEIGLLPVMDKCKIPSAKINNGVEGRAVLVCADGAVRIVDLATLKTVCLASIEDEKFVSAAYCNSKLYKYIQGR